MPESAPTHHAEATLPRRAGGRPPAARWSLPGAGLLVAVAAVVPVALAAGGDTGRLLATLAVSALFLIAGGSLLRVWWEFGRVTPRAALAVWARWVLWLAPFWFASVTLRMFLYPEPGVPPSARRAVAAWAGVASAPSEGWAAEALPPGLVPLWLLVVAVLLALVVLRPSREGASGGGGSVNPPVDARAGRLVALVPGLVLLAGPVADRLAGRGVDGPLLVALTLAGTTVAAAAAGRLFIGGAEWVAGSRFRAAVAGIVWASLVVRLLSFLGPLSVEAEFGDPAYYHFQALLLDDGYGFVEPFGAQVGEFIPTAFHPPLYSAYLAAGSLFGADSYLAHKTLSALAALIGVVAAAWLGRRLAGERAGILAAALVAAAPNLWMIDGLLWPEGVYTAAVGVLLVATYRWLDAPGWGRAAQVGALVAVAAYLRGEALLLAPILLGPAVLWPRFGAPASLRFGRRLLHLVVMAAVAVGVLAPWTIRNAVTFENPVLLSTNSDEVLFYANCEDTYYGDLLGSWSYPCQERDRSANPGEEPQGEETVRVRYWRDKGVEYAMANVDRWPVVVAARVGRQWDVYRPGQNISLMALESRPPWLSRIGQWWYWLSLPFAASGWWWVRRREPTWPLSAQLVTVTVTAALVYGSIRFRTAGDYVLLILAAVALNRVVALVGERLAARRGEVAT